MRMHIVIIGLSITSSWGNGHATTYRSLISQLTNRGHDVLFLEKDVPWYAANRDMPDPPFCRTALYKNLAELRVRFSREIRDADLVIIGSFVPEGVKLSYWVTETARGLTAFYDIDTPVTLSKLAKGDYEYLSPDLIPYFDMYLSFTGGPILMKLQREFGSPFARPLYCSVDPELYFPEENDLKWDLGYLGTYSRDRQNALKELLIKPSKTWDEGKFIVAGSLYPESSKWPPNIERIDHLPPSEHRSFYNSQRFTLNITREDMIRAGWSPSVRLFEAAACGTPIISDWWTGLDQFFKPNEEILLASSEQVIKILTDFSEHDRLEIGRAAQRKCLKNHSAKVRAEELEMYADEVKKLSCAFKYSSSLKHTSSIKRR